MTLRKIRSSLINTMEIVMCNTCISKRLEPRYIVIIAARTAGIDSVRKVISERRYLGDLISASDIL
jgi:hypothetical protein